MKCPSCSGELASIRTNPPGAMVCLSCAKAWIKNPPTENPRLKCACGNLSYFVGNRDDFLRIYPTCPRCGKEWLKKKRIVPIVDASGLVTGLKEEVVGWANPRPDYGTSAHFAEQESARREEKAEEIADRFGRGWDFPDCPKCNTEMTWDGENMVCPSCKYKLNPSSRRPEVKIETKLIDYHRNGISGRGFWVVHFVEKTGNPELKVAIRPSGPNRASDNSDMLAAPEECYVIELAHPEEHWRGDNFTEAVDAAIYYHYAKTYGKKTNPYGLGADPDDRKDMLSEAAAEWWDYLNVDSRKHNSDPSNFAGSERWAGTPPKSTGDWDTLSDEEQTWLTQALETICADEAADAAIDAAMEARGEGPDPEPDFDLEGDKNPRPCPDDEHDAVYDYERGIYVCRICGKKIEVPFLNNPPHPAFPAAKPNSTRANIRLVDDKDDKDGVWFYKHGDGYPEYMLPLLREFLSWVKDGRIRADASQSSGWLVLLGAGQFVSFWRKFATKAAPEDRELAKQRLMMPYRPPKTKHSYNWKVGEFEPTSGVHGDIDYLYTINMDARTILIKEEGGPSWLDDGVSPTGRKEPKKKNPQEGGEKPFREGEPSNEGNPQNIPGDTR